MPRARDFCIGLAGLAGAAAAGVAAHRSATLTLPGAVRQGIAHALGIPESAVSIGHARIGLRGLVIDDLAAAQLGVRHAEFMPSAASLFTHGVRGTLRAEGILLEDPPIGAFDRVEIARAELHIGPHEVRGHAHGVEATLASDTTRTAARISIDAIGIELERRSKGPELARAALTGFRVGPIGALAGVVVHHGDTYEIRAAGEGARLVAHLSAAGADVRVDLDRRDVTWNAENASALASWGLPQGRVTASGSISANAPRAPLGRTGHFTASLQLERAELTVPRLAPTPVTVDGSSIVAHGEIREQTFAAEIDLALGHSHVTATLRRDAADDEEADGDVLTIEAQLPRTECADLLASVPLSLKPALDGMALAGQLAGSVRISLPLATPRQLELDGELDNKCRVVSEAPLADVSRLRSDNALVLAHDATTKPTYRPIDRIPPIIASTFVESEDGRFFQHHGLDLAQIRRAMAHDLEAQSPGRGGSTITQQVAKNLFLSGERTFGRKLEEAVIAWRLEEVLGKRRILELYLNLVELGPGTFGVVDGARNVLDKDLSAVTAEDAAMLAALLPAPRRGLDDAWRKRYRQLRTRLPGLKASQRGLASAAAELQP